MPDSQHAKYRDLSEFGLSDHESRIYWALVENGPCTMAELAQKASVPRTKVYANVRKLEQKGFVEFLPDKRYMCRAVSPEIVLKPLFERKKNELESMKEQLDRLIQLFSQIKDKDGIQRKEFWTIKERVKGTKTLRDELAQAHEEVVMLLGKSSFRLLKELHEDLRAAYERGVKNRIVVSSNADQLQGLEGFKDFAEVRVVSREPSDNLIIIDKKTTIIISSARLGQDPSEYSAIYIKEAGVAHNVLGLVDLVWLDLPDITSFLSFARSGQDVSQMAKASSASVYYNTVLFALGKTLVDTLGEKRTNEILRAAASYALQLLEEEGLRLVRSNIEDSLKLLVDLASVSEKISINYISEEPLKTLFYEVSDASSVSYRRSRELKVDMLMTAWGMLTEAIFDRFGYHTSTALAVYDEERRFWMARKRVYRKDEKAFRLLDYLFGADGQKLEATAQGHTNKET